MGFESCQKGQYFPVAQRAAKLCSVKLWGFPVTLWQAAALQPFELQGCIAPFWKPSNLFLWSHEGKVVAGFLRVKPPCWKYHTSSNRVPGFIFQNGFLGGVQFKFIPQKSAFLAKFVYFSCMWTYKNWKMNYSACWLGSIQEWGCICADTVAIS